MVACCEYKASLGVFGWLIQYMCSMITCCSFRSDTVGFVSGGKPNADDMYIEDDEESDTGETEFDDFVEIIQVGEEL